MRQEVINFLKDPDFMAKVMEKENLGSVKELFSEKGLKLSSEEIEKIGKELYSSLILAYRISDDQSSKISGGVNEQDNWDKMTDTQRIDWLKKEIDSVKDEVDSREDILKRNKVPIAIGAVSLFVGSFYGIKTLIKYIEKIKKKKNWIRVDEKTKK